MKSCLILQLSVLLALWALAYTQNSTTPSANQTLGEVIQVCGEWTNQTQWTIGSASIKQVVIIDLNCSTPVNTTFAVATPANNSAAVVTVNPGSVLKIVNISSKNREIRINGVLVLLPGSFLNATLRIGNTGPFGKQAVIPILSYTGTSSPDFNCSDTLTNGTIASVNTSGCPAGYTCKWTATTPVTNTLCVLSIQLDQIPTPVVTPTVDNSNPGLYALFALLGLPIAIPLIVCLVKNSRKQMNAEKSRYVVPEVHETFSI